MSSGEDRKSPQELVIVRSRSGGHDDGHHGGAWKIAFADFMTALMCFFLVMWLINSTDKKTITQIATYFNPLRLNDRIPSQKGVQDPGPQEPRPEKSEAQPKESAKAKAKSAAQAAKGGKNGGAPSSSGASETTEADPAEQELQRNPRAALDRIARSTPKGLGAPMGGAVPKEAGLPRDVFDAPVAAAPPATQGMVPDGGLAPSPDNRPADARPEADQKATAEPEARRAGPGAPPATPDADTKAAPARGLGPAGLELERRIRAALSDLRPGSKPAVDVTEGPRELLVSLTDEFDFGMFAVASSRPTREFLLVMERIAKVLETTPGSIVVRGHTDGRPFRTPENDNWRLSMARAQIAYFMLARGGLKEERVRRLEGHADRSLKNTTDPLAAQNRRIEIMIEKVGP